MGGKTSTAVKNKFYASRYDTIRFFVPKGQKERLIRLMNEKYEENPISLNEFVCSAIYAALDLDYKTEWEKATAEAKANSAAAKEAKE